MVDARKQLYWHDKLTVNFIYDDYINKNALHPITLNCTLCIKREWGRWIYALTYNMCKIDIIETQHHLQNQQHFNKRIVFYRPILFLNDFWSSNQDIYPINETTR
jgi:hypothetical protein